MLNETNLMGEIRSRFDLIDTCPVQGERIYFENAGGALTLKSVVECSAEFAAIPDNQGRANVASQRAEDLIAQCRADIRSFLNAQSGQVFLGESGTELLFRLIRTACAGTQGGNVVGSSLEHPASSSAAIRWAEITQKPYYQVIHNSQTGTVTADDYRQHVTPETQVATIIHASPVTGIGVDVAAIAEMIRSVAPDCIIIVDGIQYAAHGGVDVDAYDVDGYVISPYKVFSRHGYGIAWVSDRLHALPHDMLIGSPNRSWEMGTRDTGAYATFSQVVEYFDWLGSRVSNASSRRGKITAAGRAIGEQEHQLCDLALRGRGEVKGLQDYPGIQVIGGIANSARKGLVSFTAEGITPAKIVAHLSANGIRAHIRKADHYSGNILNPLGLDSCVRISFCHYNTEDEVLALLKALPSIIG